MLKRHQVLLNDWLTDYLRDTAAQHDISFSETIRIIICIFAGTTTQAKYPEYKFPFTTDQIGKMLKGEAAHKLNDAQMNKLMSQIYFEARKAIEFAKQKQ